MKLSKTNKLIYSPTDLTKFVESSYSSWMDRKSLTHKDLAAKKDLKDLKVQALFDKGFAFEKEQLEEMKKTQDVYDASIEMKASPDKKAITQDEKINKTLDAMKAGKDIIYQAFLKKDDLEGFADFLFKVPGKSNLGDYHYTVKDTKLSKIPKAKFILQLCAYCEMLEEVQGRLPDNISIILGTKEEMVYKVKDYYYYYLKIKEMFLDFHAKFDESNSPLPEKDESSNDWSEEARRYLEAIDHISLVANISPTQIKTLANKNISTIKQLAQAKFDEVSGIKFEKFEKLVTQAQLQISSKTEEVPFYNVYSYNPNNPKGLCFLPNKNKTPVYLFVDNSSIAHPDGLSFYWILKIGEAEYKYLCLNKEEEKEAAKNVISKLSQHFTDLEYNSSHIYTFGANSLNLLKHISAQNNILTTELKDLLKYFIDLAHLFKQSVVVGVDEYSPKNISRLLPVLPEMVDGMLLFNEYELESDTELKAQKIRELEANETTYLLFLESLRQWMLEEQEKNNIPYESQNQHEKKFMDEFKKPEAPEDEGDEEEEVVFGLDDFNDEIYANLGDKERIVALLELLCNFYKREDDLAFSDLMDKYRQNEEDWDENLDCLAFITFEEVSAEKENRFKYSYDPIQDTKIKEGDAVQLFQNRRLKGKVVALNTLLGTIEIEYAKKYIKYVNAFHEDFPQISIIANNFISKQTLINAVKAVTLQAKLGLMDNLDHLGISSSLYDFLMRNPPKLMHLKKGEDIYQESDDIINATREVSENMQKTCLIIQGPPGAGKTYTSASMILNLLKQGKRIAITSNSHKAVNNLMLKIEALSKDEKYNFVKINSKEEEELKVITNLTTLPTASKYDVKKHPAQVFGGTAYSFSNPIFKEHFDYLFVDEAGQFALAHLVAVSQSSHNLILIGDQMQLEQPTQAVHPGESGDSCLEYYLKGHKTIPRTIGFFLPETRRMNPYICEFISNAFYEGRLNAHADNKHRKLVLDSIQNKVVKIDQGIQYLPVYHSGNVQSSVEEIEAIKIIVHELVGQTIQVEDEKRGILEKRLITLEDFIFVSPYNLQVIKLKEALGEEAKVGSVDLFQGQEAPIVIISMCSSDGMSGRGLDFLLSENRMNVAISRGKCIAIVVGNPDLCKTKVSAIESIKLLNMYCQILNYQK